jgi:membrane protease YdiL (CAAX protease family)
VTQLQVQLPAAPRPQEWRPLLPMLACFCAATVLLIPLEWFLPGMILWAMAVVLVARSGRAAVRRNMGLLLGAILLLGLAPINTDRDTRHFIDLALAFGAVILLPYLWMRWKAPHELDWRFLPRRFWWRDIIYVVISVPLAWGIIQLYFFTLNPELPTHWPMPPEPTTDALRRLFIGINAVGIWDELFFINTVYVLLRRLFPARLAIPAQAVVYTSVLYDMAFTGWGIVIVYLFALTQGAMYERSGILLWVLIVHLIVDYFLVLAILQYHYPGQSLVLF